MFPPAHSPASNIPPDQRDLFLAFVDTVADYAIVLLDTNGVITSWNRGARRMLGYDASEAIGLHFSRLYTEDAVARGWPQKALLLTQRHRKLEDGGWLIRKDGSRFWCSNSITAVHNSDDVLIGMGMVIRDVTQQMESSERLWESESTFRLLVQNVYDYAIFMLDTEGRVASWNVGANRIKGYASREIVGQHFSVFYPPEDRMTGKPERLLSIARDQGRVEDEGWRVRKDGTQFWASVTLTAVYDEHHHEEARISVHRWIRAGGFTLKHNVQRTSLHLPVASQLLFQELHYRLHTGRTSATGRHQQCHRRAVKLPVGQHPHQSAARDSVGHVPFRTEHQSQALLCPLTRNTAVIAGIGSHDTHGLSCQGSPPSAGAWPAESPQRHVLVVLPDADAGVREQVAGLRRRAVLAQVGRAGAQPACIGGECAGDPG